jgi:hypothetical protein
MNHDGRRVSKSAPSRNIIDALPEGWRRIRINWKKGVKIHVAAQHGRVKVLN